MCLGSYFLIELSEFEFKTGDHCGELVAYHEDGWKKFHCFKDNAGLRHGEFVMYHENGGVARRELFVKGMMVNVSLSNDEDRLFASLKYGVPLIDET